MVVIIQTTPKLQVQALRLHSVGQCEACLLFKSNIHDAVVSTCNPLWCKLPSCHAWAGARLYSC
jgi:hypothetical protein